MAGRAFQGWEFWNPASQSRAPTLSPKDGEKDGAPELKSHAERAGQAPYLFFTFTITGPP